MREPCAVAVRCHQDATHKLHADLGLGEPAAIVCPVPCDSDVAAPDVRLKAKARTSVERQVRIGTLSIDVEQHELNLQGSAERLAPVRKLDPAIYESVANAQRILSITPSTPNPYWPDLVIGDWNRCADLTSVSIIVNR
jgi:hypothetical protein